MVSRALVLAVAAVLLAAAGLSAYVKMRRSGAAEQRLEAFLTDISPRQPNLSLAGAPAVALEVEEKGRYVETATPQQARVFVVPRRSPRGQVIRRIVARKLVARRLLEARAQGVVVMGGRAYFLGPISIQGGRPVAELLDRDGGLVGNLEFLGREEGIYRALVHLRGEDKPYELLVAPGHPNSTRLFIEVNTSRPANLTAAIEAIRASYRG